MSKPTKERNAGARAIVKAIRRRLVKRQRQYEADGLTNESYVIIEALGFVSAAVRLAGKRKGGVGGR